MACVQESFLVKFLTVVIAIQAAILLSRLDKESQSEDASGQLWVGKGHISQVLDLRRGFLKYREGVYQMTDNERAWRKENRTEPGNSTAEDSE